MTNLLKQFGPKKEKIIQYTNPLNSFNSWKVMFHANRMWKILDWTNNNTGKLPTPVYVTVDPTNVCNHACPFCISAHIQESDNTTLSKEKLISLANVLKNWKVNDDHEYHFVKSVVIAGGGEPLANPATKDFIKQLAHNHENESGPEFAIISNGELLTEEISKLLVDHARWAGFSVDSGNTEDHRKMHASKKKGVDNFAKIIDNITILCNMNRYSKRKVPLTIGYKFNIHPDSYTSIVEAARIAKEIGCTEIQYKPTFIENAVELMPPIIEPAQQNIAEARRLYEDEKFKVHGVIHKFGAAWEPNHDFGICTMTPLGLIFSADGNLYLCCDRRGDPTLDLGSWHDGIQASLPMIEKAWGSDHHRKLIEEIKVESCPRCTLYHYQKLAQEAFLNDNMTRNFL